MKLKSNSYSCVNGECDDDDNNDEEVGGESICRRWWTRGGLPPLFHAGETKTYFNTGYKVLRTRLVLQSASWTSIKALWKKSFEATYIFYNFCSLVKTFSIWRQFLQNVVSLSYVIHFRIIFLAGPLAMCFGLVVGIQKITWRKVKFAFCRI